MDLAIKLIVLLPLLAAAIAGLFCRVIGDRPAQIVTCAALLTAAALSVFVFVRVGLGHEESKLVVVKLFNWIGSGSLDIAWSLRVDTLTAVMLIVVTGVSGGSFTALLLFTFPFAELGKIADRHVRKVNGRVALLTADAVDRGDLRAVVLEEARLMREGYEG